MRIVPITREFAEAIATWTYEPPYDVYSTAGADPAYFTDPANGFVALVEDDGELIGFRSFGPDGRVPGGTYDETALDTGGGLRPDLTGRGMGSTAIATGLDYGVRVYAPKAWRITVASFNARALKVVGSLGFRRVEEFTSPSGAAFTILRAPVEELAGRE